jgi:hypothetical protein
VRVTVQRASVSETDQRIQTGVAARCPVCQQVVDVKGNTLVPHYGPTRKVCPGSGKGFGTSTNLTGGSGSAIRVASDYGVSETTANDDGKAAVLAYCGKPFPLAQSGQIGVSGSEVSPYGIELDTEWRDRAGLNSCGPAEASYMKQRTKGHTETTISGDTRADWSEAFELVPSLQIAYVWHASVFTQSHKSPRRDTGFAGRGGAAFASSVDVVCVDKLAALPVAKTMWPVSAASRFTVRTH